MKLAEDNYVEKEAFSMLKKKAEWVLNDQIIPFWLNMRDDDYGGYYGLLDFDLILHKKADKGAILNSRILYFFSECAITFNDARFVAAAEHAYDFLMRNFIDTQYGGVYWSVTYDGKKSDTIKHTYNQAFAIYGLSSYYVLTKNKNAINMAMKLFELIEDKCMDRDGYLECFDQKWTPVENDKLSENNVTAQRTMNTLLHIFEGYSNLYKQTNDEKVGAALRRILTIYKEKVFNRKLKRQEVFFDKDYNSLINLHSFGHDIESSWLIDWGCTLLNDEKLMEEISIINDILAEEIYRKAYIYSSVCNEQENNRIDQSRVWWVQSEAVVGFLNMWQKHPEQVKYLKAEIKIWHYIQENLVDQRSNSEWFWAVDENGVPLRHYNMADAWKCPYHNGRMCLEIIRRNT